MEQHALLDMHGPIILCSELCFIAFSLPLLLIPGILFSLILMIMQHFKSPATIIFCLLHVQLTLQEWSFAYYKHIFTIRTQMCTYSTAGRKTHIRCLRVALDMSDAVDKNIARLTSSQALPVSLLFNPSLLLPLPCFPCDPLSRCGRWLSSDSTENRLELCAYAWVRHRKSNTGTKTNNLPKLLSTMNFDVYSWHCFGIPPVKTLSLFFPGGIDFSVSQEEKLVEGDGEKKKKTKTQQALSTQSYTCRNFDWETCHRFDEEGAVGLCVTSLWFCWFWHFSLRSKRCLY